MPEFESQQIIFLLCVFTLKIIYKLHNCSYCISNPTQGERQAATWAANPKLRQTKAFGVSNKDQNNYINIHVLLLFDSKKM